MSSSEPEPCDVPNGDHEGRLRFYANGWKCDTHSPWADRGMAEPQPGYGASPRDLPPSPIADSAVFDQHAIASGKRRSSPQAYRAAQAATANRKEH